MSTSTTEGVEASEGHDSAAIKIQKFFRNATGKKKVFHQIRSEVDAALSACQTSSILPATELFITGQKLLFVYHVKKDKKRFVSFCKIVVAGMETEEVKVWYVTLALSKAYAVAWIKQIKQLLTMACSGIKVLKLGYPEDDHAINCFLSLIVTFCDYTLWKFSAKAGSSIKPTLHQLCVTFVNHIMEKRFYPIMNELLTDGLCCTVPKLSGQNLPAAMGIRLLALEGFSSSLMMMFIHHVLSVPASILHLHSSSPEVIHQLHKVDFLSRLMEVLSNMKISHAGLESNAVISMTCNVFYLASLEGNGLKNFQKKRVFLGIMLELLPVCQKVELNSQNSASFWHPLLGWTKGKMDTRVIESLIHIRKQLQCLWQPYFVDALFSELLEINFDEKSTKGKKRMLESPPISQILNHICEVYLLFLSIMSNISSDILIGLGCNQVVVYKIWCFLREATKLHVKMIVGAESSPVNILSLFCQMMLYMLVILDDYELFEKQKHFTTSDFSEMSKFLNNLLFHILWEEKDFSVSSHCRSLLTMLYNRDSKQHFCSDEDWLIKDVKVSLLMKEVESKTRRGLNILSQLPHVIPHRKRVELFHQWVKKEKESLGIERGSSHSGPTTFITIRRERMIEDGYQQLGLLSASALKGTIKVKFINPQGLDEAGIDETGVFKEFLEETLKLAFDPDLNLFKSNAQGHIFPSSTSHVHENHLGLFEFIGRILGKAVYEGIVVDIPFAPFFLSHMKHSHLTYSNYFDELESLDQQMYSSLNFIKHYDGDMTDLCLTFSWDEEFMGKTVTHELVPGGCGIPVTASNRLSYVHRMALFRMSTQLKKQTDAFIRGFHFLIDPSLIHCFSFQELQKLISGDQVDIDVDDLRKHTEYLGGYHGHHKVILWLWDILKTQFNPDERGKFLKFVTSCSRPPLLGFKHLHPPFTVRCVQVSSSEETDDSLSRIIKGFFSKSPQSKDRLPSASTCFNLLKLPNYPKKAILKEKLKYAIQANCGFELS